MTIGDRAEFEWGKNAALLVKIIYLRKMKKSRQTNFYLSDMITRRKKRDTYISFKHLQHDAKKMYALYMRFFWGAF